MLAVIRVVFNAPEDKTDPHISTVLANIFVVMFRIACVHAYADTLVSCCVVLEMPVGEFSDTFSTAPVTKGVTLKRSWKEPW